MPNLLAYEQPLWDANGIVVGIDEAGRGPMAGPLAVGAVILDPNAIPDAVDSKALSEAKRNDLADVITAQAVSWGVGLVSAEEIDALGMRHALHAASRLAWDALMQRLNPDLHKPSLTGAQAALTAPPVERAGTTFLIDGPNDLCPWFLGPKACIIKGDGLSRSIGAASILAKTTRDAIMIAADAIYPEYGFASHKGYGSQAHMAAIEAHGPTPLHRLSFGKLKRYRPVVEEPAHQRSLFDALDTDV